MAFDFLESELFLVLSSHLSFCCMFPNDTCPYNCLALFFVSSVLFSVRLCPVYWATSSFAWGFSAIYCCVLYLLFAVKSSWETTMWRWSLVFPKRRVPSPPSHSWSNEKLHWMQSAWKLQIHYPIISLFSKGPPISTNASLNAVYIRKLYFRLCSFER
jgi:hypothetical protein